MWIMSDNIYSAHSKHWIYVAIKIIIINQNEFHLELFICGGIWREVWADQGASGNEVMLFKTSTNTENMEALNASAGRSQVLL